MTRHDCNDYIYALEAADDGDLGPPVELACQLHQRSVLQAIST